MALPMILQQLSNTPAMGNMAQIRNTIAMLKAAKNPQALMQQMMSQNNPGMQKAMQYVREHGNDPKAAFEALAREKGLDPEEIMNML